MNLDINARRNLEITEKLRDKKQKRGLCFGFLTKRQHQWEEDY